jgi:hypothetical protein
MVTRGRVVKIGVGKFSAVLGLCQGTASGEMGVTRISPSNPRPGGETSIGTLPKFRKQETSKSRSARKLRRRKWSSYRRRWRITWFNGDGFSFRGLSFSKDHLWLSLRCS